MIGIYRNHPGGMGPISENTCGKMTPVYLEDIAADGNRAQRRWAKKKLAKINREKARQQTSGTSDSTPPHEPASSPALTTTLPSVARNQNHT